MDIIVTTPKTRMKEAALEAEDAKRTIVSGGESHYFRNVGRHVPKMKPGDKVFYVEDGAIRGYALLDYIEEFPDGKKCDTTGRQYTPGIYIFMDAQTWKWIKPIPMKGFQGYRYRKFDESEINVIGNWTDPKPTDPNNLPLGEGGMRGIA